MYFEIENTPEHIKRARRAKVVQKKSPKEECPRLVLAPFRKPPQIVFENVPIGSTCEKELEVFNPSKQVQQITLGRALPPGLVIHLPAEWLEVEPETCYCLTMEWTPLQPTALRETIRFTNENRGRYDVIIVLKSAMILKEKQQKKGFKTTPGKMKKKSNKRSPVSIYKRKSEIIHNTTKITTKERVVQYTQQNVLKISNKENIQNFYDRPEMEYRPEKCPFDSPTSFDLNFDTSEIFSNYRKTRDENLLQNTYDKSYSFNSKLMENPNVLKPSNKVNCDVSASDLFDNLTFTPLKAEKLEKGPKIIVSLNSASDLDDSLEVQSYNKDNEQPNSMICITSKQQSNKWLPVNYKQTKILDEQLAETSTISNKKVPNTSSPKELNSPNFSMNTELSRISDLSFHPQRFSTERKTIPKFNNETIELMEDPNSRMNSDTYTKDSPNSLLDFKLNVNAHELRPPQYFMREQPKMCRQALFRESQQFRETFDKNYLNPPDVNYWNRDGKIEPKSPPRSITPPLQSIPEESSNFYDTQTFNKSESKSLTSTFTMNRTFDKLPNRNSLSTSTMQTWSKKAIRADPEIWKIPTAPPRKSLRPKASIGGKDSLSGKLSNTSTTFNKTSDQNLSLNIVGNVYSQSSTQDPFQSVSYFYDEEAVHKFEEEFKRWLNSILTPPADLESNIEQKVDLGKAWLENRNKEVPAAPTKEQVCSEYHNSHRLESLRKAARTLLKSPEIAQVFLKLNAQIEKKLIAIRNDRNLHLDVGLQKIIMELLLSYNPLWLRIGLEAIYGIVLPLKSNSDIFGLTVFIIQRLFKNPFLKNKHSKSTAPNMLLPAYMEAIKKFTLKKFFMLVFFLDQAKQKKLIPHDPCLFCRNAVCKESREIIIRFTKELIAGIGDITKHLRPIGYVVSHKQTYLDEYKYAVHNIALDIRDGVRLTKVMEIILMKNGLLQQMRAPAISRLQKIHNVQVALNALKEANFVIVGDITAQDIADGHREKTLSLLWQLIHVFRAPLFEKAANVIQTWWRKKYEVILEKRKQEERERQKLNTAASVIQYWWRRIQYNRLVEWQMRQVTSATVVFQKYCRMWLCRSRLRIMKKSILKIEEWYHSIKMMRKAKATLETLKAEKELLRHKSATIIQSHVKRWLRMKEYQATLRKIVLIQSTVRRYILETRYKQLKKSVMYVQKVYRGRLLMKKEMQKYSQMRNAIITIQSTYRMIKERRQYLKLKKSVLCVELRYKALLQMRKILNSYHQTRRSAILIQASWRGVRCRKEYQKQRHSVIVLQRRFKALILMKQQREKYLKIRKAAITLQRRVRSYQAMKKVRQSYMNIRKSAIVLQRRFRAQRVMKIQMKSYLQLRNAAIVLQRRYRAVLIMRQKRTAYLKLKEAAVVIQTRYRALIMMREKKQKYTELLRIATKLQRRFRAQMIMKEERAKYLKLKAACILIQNKYRALVIGRQQKHQFWKQKQAAIKIQNWYRSCTKTKEIKKQFDQTKRSCVTIQRIYRAYIIGRKEREHYIKIRTAVLHIQNYYRSYVEMKIVREKYLQMKTATVTIQRYYKSLLETRKQREDFLKKKTAAVKIQNYYRRCVETRRIRQQYVKLKRNTIFIQRLFRSICTMKIQRQEFLRMRKCTMTIQRKYRALLAMRSQKQQYLAMRVAAVTIQRRFRAQSLMKEQRIQYLITRNACVYIQRFYRAHLAVKKQRYAYLKLKESALVLQRRYRALAAMRREKQSYTALRNAVINIQRRFRARNLMIKHRTSYLNTLNTIISIQRRYRANKESIEQKRTYQKLRKAAITIQTWYRTIVESKRIKTEYLQLRHSAIVIQRRYRAKIIGNSVHKQFLKLKTSTVILQSTIRMLSQRKKYMKIRDATVVIQRFYRSYRLYVYERKQFIQLKLSITKLQAYVRSFIARKRFLRIRNAALTIQAAYKLMKRIQNEKKRRESAAICIQKNVKRYFAQKKYLLYRKQVVFVQRLWQSKLVTRLLRCEFNQKRRLIIKLQARIRGYLVRKQVESKKAELKKTIEEKRRNHAATIIQAQYRGHRARVANADRRVVVLRRRWREGALISTQESLKERNEEAMDVLRNMADIETVIRAFRSLELLTEVFPMLYNNNASSIVRRVYVYMSVTNRSISSIELLKSAAALLVNLTRYRITGPKIYARDRIPPILKFMLRFSNSEVQLFCILCTYLWLFHKYDGIREDLAEYLHQSENKKLLSKIRGNVERMKRMASNVRHDTHAPQSHNYSMCSNASYRGDSVVLPALEPDYGITRADKPKYFEDANQAITCLFQIYDL